MTTFTSSYTRAKPLLAYSKQESKFYYYKIYPVVESIHLESIEHHCKYKDPGIHKSEILGYVATAFVINDHATRRRSRRKTILKGLKALRLYNKGF